MATEPQMDTLGRPVHDDLTLAELTTPAADGALPVGERWAGFGGAFGGLIIAAAAQSMAAVAPEGRALRSIHADLQGAVAPGTLQFDASLDRSGRAVSFASTSGEQGGRARITASGVFGDRAPGVDYAPTTRGIRPDVPPPLTHERWDTAGTSALHAVEYRPAGLTFPMAGASEADLGVWLRIADDDTPLDATRALMLLDAPAPGLFATFTTPLPIPTIEFTAHLLPALHATTSPWALARMQTIVAGDGYAIDDCELWDEAGELVALARQLRRVLVL